MAFPHFRQYDAMDCGPTCLRMIAMYYGRDISILKLRQAANISREGVSMLGISQAAESVGFRTVGSRVSFEQLDDDARLPCILHWRQHHFVVLPPQNYSRRSKRRKILIADPGEGLIRVDIDTFLESWQGGAGHGLILELEPTESFFNHGPEDTKPGGLFRDTLSYYLRQHRAYFLQVIAGLLAGSLLQLLLPFLTQSIVDTGINTHNLQFIYIVLAAQFMLFFARTAIEFIRSRLLLFISTRINVSLLTGFWYKLMKLPMAFFDTKLSGDIQQRLQDQHVIERFLTGQSLSLLFAVFNLAVFSVVLLMYRLSVFGIFVSGSLLYFLWARMFSGRRRDLNYKRFFIAGKEHSATLQLIHGIQEIKLNTSEQFFRWDWEHLQARLFRLHFKSLSLDQYQQAGAFFINESKNILITFFVARLVLDGQLTLGAMLAIQYVIGQLNSPVEQLIGFSQAYQDARIALERLGEIHQVADEEPDHMHPETELPDSRTITVRDLSFAYPGALQIPVLKHISLVIPEQRVTAIVGMSGSGKTTLLKLLLKFYDQYSGRISVGGAESRVDKAAVPGTGRSDERNRGGGPEHMAGTDLKSFSHARWRRNCGCVLQDGYIFNDTIAQNIAVGEAFPDRRRLADACRSANILGFVEALPLGFNARIGSEGIGISQGQRQRILIARAVYKNPEYLFFDEATNALDASNERVIMENLNRFFHGRTVVVVAHRLSTVKHADHIVVLHDGALIEAGTHEQLTREKGHYYELVKNQLELGD